MLLIKIASHSLINIIPHVSLIPQHVNPQVVVVSRELGRLAQNLENTLMSHVVPNLFRTSALYDEQLLDTSVTDNRIRINFYYTPKRVRT